MISIWLVVSMGGYGDPVAGTPSPEGRAVHVWTNAVRVDPEAFRDDYLQGGCDFDVDFSADEQAPKAPLRHDADLMEVADVHTLDMYTVDVLQHDSSDGTVWSDRVWSYYGGGAIAENIAWNFGDERAVVASGWMCSGGHRANIMNATYDDLGAARYVQYLTQNFGQSFGASPDVRSAAHAFAGNDVELYAAIGAASAPDAVDVVVDGVAQPMSVAFGTASQGVYAATVPDDGACHEYYVRSETGGTEVRYPETGSYGWGPCAYDDTAAAWFAGQLEPSATPVFTTDPWAAGATVDLAVTGVDAGSSVHFVLGTSTGAGPCPGALGGLCLEVSGTVRYLGAATADASGEALMPFTVPAGASGRAIHLQAVGDVGGTWVLSDVHVEQVP